jgi:hypothetical protein
MKPLFDPLETPACFQKAAEPLSLAQLHVILCVLMTRFYTNSSAKTAQIIVSHLRLVMEHPEIRKSDEHLFLYHDLFLHWLKTTHKLLRQDTLN